MFAAKKRPLLLALRKPTKYWLWHANVQILLRSEVFPYCAMFLVPLFVLVDQLHRQDAGFWIVPDLVDYLTSLRFERAHS